MSHRVAKSVFLLAGGVLLGILGWIVFVYDPPRADIAWRVVAYEVGNPDTISVTFEVDMEPSREARCQVAAFGAGGDSAGRLTDVQVGPSAGRTTRLTVVVPTEEPAASASVATCVFVG